MSIVKILELADVPAEGGGKSLQLEHPYTYIRYELALFKVNEKYYVITNRCTLCNGWLSEGKLNGLVVSCVKEHLWNIKTGVCKFIRTNSLPTYNVLVEADGLYINI